MPDSDTFDLQAPRRAPTPSEPRVDRDQADFSDPLPMAHTVAPLVEAQQAPLVEIVDDARTVTAAVPEPSPGPGVPVPRYVLLTDARTAPKPLPVPRQAELPPPPGPAPYVLLADARTAPKPLPVPHQADLSPPTPYTFVTPEVRPAPTLTEAAAVSAAIFAAAQASRLAHRQRVDGAVRDDHLAERQRLQRTVMIWGGIQGAVLGWGVGAPGGAAVGLTAGAILGSSAGLLASRARPWLALLVFAGGLAVLALGTMLLALVLGQTVPEGQAMPLVTLVPSAALLTLWWWSLLTHARNAAVLALPVVAAPLLLKGTAPSTLIVHGEHARRVATANDLVAALVRQRRQVALVGGGMLWIWLTAWLQWFGVGGAAMDTAQAMLACVGAAGAWMVARSGGGPVVGMLVYGLPVALAGGVVVGLGLTNFMPLTGVWLWAGWLVTGAFLGMASAQADLAVKQRTG